MKYDFLPFREAVRARMVELLANNALVFRADVKPDDLWAAYLSGFPDEATRQDHNCNCCKSFIRRVANLVVVVDCKIVPLIGAFVNPSVAIDFLPSMEAMLALLRNAPISGVFGTSDSRVGTESNVAEKEYGVRRFNHFYVDVPRMHRRSVSKVAELNTSKLVLFRALSEIKPEAVTDVLDLIAANNLYRGDTHQAALLTFQKLQKDFMEADDKDVFTWGSLDGLGGSITHIRNTSVGTLLVNLSDGMTLPEAVGRYEAMVAPSNYQRPKAIVTARQIEEARKVVDAAGYGPSLKRRHARIDEVPVDAALYVHRSTGLGIGGDLFDEMAAEVNINPRKFAKAKEVSIEDFLAERNGMSALEMLVERSHFVNFTSLLTGQNPGAPSLFSHGNAFSWAYSGGVADSIKERVKRAGGKVDGVLRVSLSWENTDDLDVHVHEPRGNHIYYNSKYNSRTGGRLDVDMNVNKLVRGAVENVTWPSEDGLEAGVYRVSVNNYTRRENIDQGYTIEVEFKGELFTFETDSNPAAGATNTVCEFSIKPDGSIKMLTSGSGSKVKSVAKWGVHSNRFYPVELLAKSPNHWGTATGAAHYLFLNRSFQNDEEPRAFFNEQLSRDLVRDHKNAFEVLGSKIKIPHSDRQASGLGFSATKRASLLVRYRKDGKQHTRRVTF